MPSDFLFDCATGQLSNHLEMFSVLMRRFAPEQRTINSPPAIALATRAYEIPSADAVAFGDRAKTTCGGVEVRGIAVCSYGVWYVSQA
jgi:hypothetical protein